MTTHMSTLTEPTEPGSLIYARYQGQGELRQWVLTYPRGYAVWISGSTACKWQSLTDQQIPEPVTTDPDGTDNSTIFDIQYPPSDPLLWDRTPKRRGAFRPDLTEQDTA